jgi:hypothetical protein
MRESKKSSSRNRRGEHLRKDAGSNAKKRGEERKIRDGSNQQGKRRDDLVCCALKILGKRNVIETWRRISEKEPEYSKGYRFLVRVIPGTFSLIGRDFLLSEGRFTLGNVQRTDDNVTSVTIKILKILAFLGSKKKSG